MRLTVKKPCPSCHSETITLENNIVFCTSCQFKLEFQCPICDSDLDEHAFKTQDADTIFRCERCQNDINIKKIRSLIEGGLVVDQKTRCSICNGPTIHRQDVNLGNRCFFFPKCSGQASLFGDKHETLVFLDFETTGLEVGKDTIIEIGALKIDEEGETIPFQTFVSPGVPISDRIVSITGITDEMVKDAPPLKKAMTDLIDFIGTSKIVAHNADFDLPWMVTSCLRHNIEIKAKDGICTLKWAKELEETRLSLGALSKKYKISHNNAHRALADAATTKELFFIFENYSKIEKPTIPLKSYVKSCEQIVSRYQRFIQP